MIVAGDFVRTGGMDAANHALASFLARGGRETHLVAHRVADDLAALRVPVQRVEVGGERDPVARDVGQRQGGEGPRKPLDVRLGQAATESLKTTQQFNKMGSSDEVIVADDGSPSSTKTLPRSVAEPRMLPVPNTRSA